MKFTTLIWFVFSGFLAVSLLASIPSDHSGWEVVLDVICGAYFFWSAVEAGTPKFNDVADGGAA